MRKRNLVLSIVFSSIIIAGAFAAALASSSLIVENIAPVYVERGAQNCLVTIKAHVTNNGESGNVNIDVVGVDAEGYQLKTVKLNGNVDSGAKKVLLEQVEMPTGTYDQIVEWELLQ